ncbi:hypothetical protein [Actinacidiphila glaucinigra]|uniref:hypothetical protein n=1 Tax=Actinacidiphila glaucinigra TaxID=235986 RepID=UPI002E3799B5|nr:hypothetical protein [Actinacidiphila glaucinigra]
MASAVWWLIAMEYEPEARAWTRAGRMVQSMRPESIAAGLVGLSALALLYFGHELYSALRDRRRSQVTHVGAR